MAHQEDKARLIHDKYKHYRQEHEAYEEENTQSGSRHPAQSPRNSVSTGTRDIGAGIYVDKTQAAVFNAQKAYRRSRRRRARRQRKRERKASLQGGEGDDEVRHPAQSPTGAGGKFFKEKPDLSKKPEFIDDSDTETSPDTPTPQRRASSPRVVKQMSAEDFLKQNVPNLKLTNARDAIRAHNKKMGTPSTPKTAAQQAEIERLREQARSHIRSFQPPKLNLAPTPERVTTGVRHACQSPSAGGLTPKSGGIFKFKDTIKKKPTLKAVTEKGLKLGGLAGGGVDEDGFKQGGKRSRRRKKQQPWTADEANDVQDAGGAGGAGGADNAPFSPATPGTPGGTSKAARRRRRKKTQEAIQAGMLSPKSPNPASPS